MSVTVSKLKDGTLKLGDTGTELDCSCQITNARVTSAYADDGNQLTVLCGDTVAPARKLDGRQLAGTLVQDFDLQASAGGVVDYLWAHELEDVPFQFVPNTTGAPTITGVVTLEVPGDSFGGDVGGQLTADFAWNIQGDVVRTYA
jgi:hypothetical protein